MNPALARKGGVNSPCLVFADEKGRVYDHPELEATGMKAGRLFRLEARNLVKLPSSSELFMLPQRSAVGFDPNTGEFIEVDTDPYSEEGRPAFAVAAFIPPGYALTHSTAYHERSGAAMLPLFAYAACVFWRGDFYATAFRVDPDFRHDERFLDPMAVSTGVANYLTLFPQNRLVPHLAVCATVNGCANAKNFFLGRFEAPIPTSPVCNAQCQGCISLQPAGRIPSTQKRIEFTPSPEEIAELALFHIQHVPDPIVSFGQGCEGEPSLSVDVIEKALKLIRKSTSKGTLNMNTNAGRPDFIARLFDAGLTNIRVSLNSVRDPYYSLYYQPRGYSLNDVMRSIYAAKARGGFVSINYLSMPGFTDSEGEAAALEECIAQKHIDMVQWRNLNYDPIQYFRDLGLEGKETPMRGMAEHVAAIGRAFPRLRMGYFNPVKAATAAGDL